MKEFPVAKYISLCIVVLFILVVLLYPSPAITNQQMTSMLPEQDTDSNRADTNNRTYYDIIGVDSAGKFNLSRYVIDTSGPEPLISIIVKTDGRFDQLDSMGFNTGGPLGSRTGNEVHLWIPIELVPEINRLESVESFRYDRPVIYNYLNAGFDTKSDCGMLMGIFDQLLPCSPRKTEFVLIYNLYIDADSISRTADDSFRKVFHVTSTGRIHFDDLKEGYYYGIIRCIQADSGIETDYQLGIQEDDTVIDSIYIKAGFISIISDTHVHQGGITGRNYYVWKGKYKPLK